MSERHARRKDRDEMPARFTLGPLLDAQVFQAGPEKLSCGVGGTEYHADLGPHGEILFEGQTFKSPSAFSVHVKRKVNPHRKADDGWTSVKYAGESLTIYRPKLEELVASANAASESWQQAATSAPSFRASPAPSSHRRRKRVKREADSETSDEDFHERQRPSTSGRQSQSLGGAVSSTSTRGRGTSQGQRSPWKDVEEDRHDPPHLCNRPPLEDCSPEDFEQDLLQFLSSRKEHELVRLLRNRRITCNNSPLDVFGLYREVIRHGGLVDNQRYDDYNRWTGSINFAGQIFPRMTNYTRQNKATSIGNQLLSNYKKFLLAYEIVHRSQDLDAPQRSGTQAVSGLDVLADVASEEANGIEVDMPSSANVMASKVPDVNAELNSEPGNFHKEGTAWSDATGNRVPESRLQEQAEQSNVLGGQLLLFSEGHDSQRQWPVIFANSQDLPYVVVQGSSTSTLLTTAERARAAIDASLPDDTLPVCIFGSQALGWVPLSACQLYTQAAGELALLQAQAHRQRSNEDLQEWLANEECSKALKYTAQYLQCGSRQEISLRVLVRKATAKYLSCKMLAMEAAMPSDGSFSQWFTWREQVRQAAKPEDLVPLILMLAQQARLYTAETGQSSMDISATLLTPQEGHHNSFQTSITALEMALDKIDQTLCWSNVLGPKSHELCCRNA